MILKSLNTGIEKYGYPLECGYSKATFNGYHIGMAVCIKNAQTGEVEKNFLKEGLGDEETRMQLLDELLHASFCMDKEEITQFDDNTHELVSKHIYYLPYYVLDHSALTPTIVADNITSCSNLYYDVQIELVLSEDNLTRYLVLPFRTKNVSVMELVYGFFNQLWSGTEEDLKALNIRWQNETDDQEAGYVLDFYDKFGHRYDLVFSSMERMRDAIVSMRLIQLKRCHEEETNHGDKIE